MPYLDMVATLDPEKNTASILVLNRDLEKRQELEIDWHDLTPNQRHGLRNNYRA